MLGIDPTYSHRMSWNDLHISFIKWMKSWTSKLEYVGSNSSIWMKSSEN